MTGDPTGDAFAVAVRAEALDVTTDVLGWRLSPEGWQEVDGLLQEMAEALAGAAIDDLAAITAELDLMGPLRIIRIGSTPVPVAVPPPVHERVERLVHALGGVSDIRRPPPDPAGR